MVLKSPHYFWIHKEAGRLRWSVSLTKSIEHFSLPKINWTKVLLNIVLLPLSQLPNLLTEHLMNCPKLLKATRQKCISHSHSFRPISAPNDDIVKKLRSFLAISHITCSLKKESNHWLETSRLGDRSKKSFRGRVTHVIMFLIWCFLCRKSWLSNTSCSFALARHPPFHRN